MELNSKIKRALQEIDFVNRYEKIAEEYNANRTPSNDRLVHIDGGEVMETIASLGYQPSFDAKEKFYKIKEEKNGEFIFGFHIILRDGNVDLVWIVKENKELLLGLPWSLYSRLLINPDYKISYPVIGSYEDIDDILEKAFTMFEEFKQVLLK